MTGSPLGQVAVLVALGALRRRLRPHPPHVQDRRLRGGTAWTCGIALGLAALTALGVVGIFYGIRIYRAEAKLPGDLALALEVGATRTSAVGSGIDRLGMRYAPAVLRLMGPKPVNQASAAGSTWRATPAA